MSPRFRERYSGTLMKSILLAIVVLTLVPTDDAHAYIDPATGSLLLQGLIALFAGATLAFKNFYRTKVKAAIDFILRRKPVADEVGADAGQRPS